MRVTIVTSDDAVLVESMLQHVDCAALRAEGKHAVQWYGSSGEVEFITTVDPDTGQQTRPPNEQITDFSPYQIYVDQWEAANARSQQQPINPKLDSMQLKTIAEILGA